MNVNYDNLPIHMQNSIRLYVEEKIEPGSFLFAVLSNDLTQAFGRADEINREAMFDWANWLYNECPRNIWGSREIVQKWIDSRFDEDQ